MYMQPVPFQAQSQYIVNIQGFVSLICLVQLHVGPVQSQAFDPTVVNTDDTLFYNEYSTTIQQQNFFKQQYSRTHFSQLITCDFCLGYGEIKHRTCKTLLKVGLLTCSEDNIIIFVKRKCYSYYSPHKISFNFQNTFQYPVYRACQQSSKTASKTSRTF